MAGGVLPRSQTGAGRIHGVDRRHHPILYFFCAAQGGEIRRGGGFAPPAGQELSEYTVQRQSAARPPDRARGENEKWPTVTPSRITIIIWWRPAPGLFSPRCSPSPPPSAPFSG